MPPAVEACNLNHWNTKEVQDQVFNKQTLPNTSVHEAQFSLAHAFSGSIWPEGLGTRTSWARTSGTTGLSSPTKLTLTPATFSFSVFTNTPPRGTRPLRGSCLRLETYKLHTSAPKEEMLRTQTSVNQEPIGLGPSCSSQ